MKDGRNILYLDSFTVLWMSHALNQTQLLYHTALHCTALHCTVVDYCKSNVPYCSRGLVKHLISLLLINMGFGACFVVQVKLECKSKDASMTTTLLQGE